MAGANWVSTMRRTHGVVVTVSVAVGLSTSAFGEPQQVAAGEVQQHLHTFEQRTYTGPVFTLDAAVNEAMVKNPTLLALRAQFDVMRQRPAQERSLMAPSFEAQIWQWPISAINPADTNMYMFMVTQDLPHLIRGDRHINVTHS